MARIAWVEDDNEHLQALVALLEEDGHEIVRFGSWKAASAALAAICSCDVLVLDIILPPVDNDPYHGLALLEQIRGEHECGMPVVVCSRVGNPGVYNRLRALGVVGEWVLSKPVRPSRLREVVNMALATRPGGQRP